MDVINFSDWHNEFVCQSPDIISVAHQLDKLRLQITNREDCSDSKCIVFRNVIHLLRQWTGNTYVGVNKSTEFRQALQIFFKALYTLH